MRKRKYGHLIWNDKTLEELEQEAIEYIQKIPLKEDKVFVGFSGGKDSVVLLDLVKKAGIPFIAGYNVTGNDPKSVTMMVKTSYPEVNFIQPKHTFFHLLKTCGLPTRLHRWCCQILKEGNDLGYSVRIMGIRAEEAWKRAARGREDEYKGRYTYKPIFHWPEWAIWEYIDKYNLVYPKDIYDAGFSRVSCVMCPFNLTGSGEPVQKRRELSKKYFPLMWKVHKRYAKEYYYMKEKTRGPWDKPFEEWYNNYWIN